MFNLPWTTWLALVGLTVSRDRRHVPFAAATFALVTALSVAFTRAWPHYVAPVAPLLYYLLARGLASWSRVGFGRSVMVATLAAQALWLVVFYVRQDPAIWFEDWSRTRAAITNRLLREERPDLVVVRYAPDHDVHQEWVYNEADIDAAEIVWAREMDPASNAALFDYFRYRRVWLLEADAHPPRLSPYGSR